MILRMGEYNHFPQSGTHQMFETVIISILPSICHEDWTQPAEESCFSRFQIRKPGWTSLRFISKLTRRLTAWRIKDCLIQAQI